MGETPDKKTAHGDEDHGLRDVHALLVVADETTEAGHPAESPLDDSAPGQHLEGWFAVDAADDLEGEIAIGPFV